MEIYLFAIRKRAFAYLVKHGERREGAGPWLENKASLSENDESGMALELHEGLRIVYI